MQVWFSSTKCILSSAIVVLFVFFSIMSVTLGLKCPNLLMLKPSSLTHMWQTWQEITAAKPWNFFPVKFSANWLPLQSFTVERRWGGGSEEEGEWEPEQLEKALRSRQSSPELFLQQGHRLRSGLAWTSAKSIGRNQCTACDVTGGGSVCSGHLLLATLAHLGFVCRCWELCWGRTD